MRNALDRNGSPFVVGARVMAYTHVERFPHFLLPPGVTGVVTDVHEDDCLVEILPDLPWRALISEEWGRKVQVSIEIDDGEPLASDEWVVTGPPSGVWEPLRAPSDGAVRDLAREVLRDLVEGWHDEEDALLYIVQGHMGQVGDSDILIRDALKGASYADTPETRERVEAQVVKVASRRLARLHKAPPPPKRWRTTVRVTFEVDVPVVLDADDIETVTLRAPGAAGDFAEECVITRKGEQVECRIADIGRATVISAVTEGQ